MIQMITINHRLVHCTSSYFPTQALTESPSCKLEEVLNIQQFIKKNNYHSEVNVLHLRFSPATGGYQESGVYGLCDKDLSYSSCPSLYGAE